MITYGLVALVAILLGFGIGTRTRQQQKMLPSPPIEMEPEAEEVKRTAKDFEKLLEAAGFRVGVLSGGSTNRRGGPNVTGSFEGTYHLTLGSQSLPGVLPDMRGWKLAYALTSEHSRCKYCKCFDRMYRLGEVTAEPAVGETCLACWKCGWILHDCHTIDRDGLGGIVEGRTNIYPVLDELMQSHASMTATARLQRAHRERSELERLRRRLDDEIVGLEEIVKARPSLPEPQS